MIKFFFILFRLLLHVELARSKSQESHDLNINLDSNPYTSSSASESNSVTTVDSITDDHLLDEPESNQLADCIPDTRDRNTNIKNRRRQVTQSCRSNDFSQRPNTNSNPSSRRKKPLFKELPPPSEECTWEEQLVTCTGPEIDLGQYAVTWVMNCIKGIFFSVHVS